MRSVVDQHHPSQIPTQDPEVLDEELVVDHRAALSVQPMDDAPLRVDVVENGVCIALISCSEDHDIEVLAEVLDDFLGMGADVDIAVDDPPLHRFEGHFYLVPLHHDLTSMDQCLIHIKNNSFSTYISSIFTLPLSRNLRVHSFTLEQLGSPQELLECQHRVVDMHARLSRNDRPSFQALHEVERTRSSRLQKLFEVHLRPFKNSRSCFLKEVAIVNISARLVLFVFVMVFTFQHLLHL